jgi:glycosyltransferase involved in cell wall biosynthesis
MRILFLSSWYPYPPNNGSKLRIYNLLRGLAQHHEVTLLSFADQPEMEPDISVLGSLCSDIQVIPWKPFEPQRWRARLGFFSLTPRSVIDTFSPEMARYIRQAVGKQSYDLVIASQLGVAGYSPCFQGVPALFEEVELGVPYEQYRQARSSWIRLRRGLTWAKHRRYLTRVLGHFSACTVVSEQEQSLVSSLVPNFGTIEVIPNCINLDDYHDVGEVPQPNHLIFTGSFRYFANYEAMAWFLQEVYPRLQAEIPHVRLTITGDHANLPLPPVENVSLTGFVDDVRPLVASAWISLAPIQVGGGTRLKILEAMALRTPVVATPKGAEGLDVRAGEHLLIADTPEAFAAATIRLLQEPGLRQELAANAYQLVSEKYDWAAVMPQFLDLVDRVAGVQAC